MITTVTNMGDVTGDGDDFIVEGEAYNILVYHRNQQSKDPIDSIYQEPDTDPVEDDESVRAAVDQDLKNRNLK